VTGPAAPGESGEDRLIARYFRPLARDPGAFGLIDDAAILTPPPGHEVVLKTDAIVGGVHFFPDDPPGAIGCKALRVNLSDLAAKGAKPAGFLMSLALPSDIGDEWLAAFAEGLRGDVEHYGCPLLGGDTVKSPGPVMVSIAAFGTLPAGTMVRRGGARSGDAVLVTGTIGDAALGLRLRRDLAAADRYGLTAAERDHLLDRFLLPQPRNALAELVRQHASGAMDVSDGLVGDLTKLCAASGVSAQIETDRVPLSAGARCMLAADPALIEPVLTGGDDYEIVLTLASERVAAFRAAAGVVAVTEIGRIIAGAVPPRFLDRDGRALTFARTSFSHF
jgi:thiamine-monophosphate kinase